MKTRPWMQINANEFTFKKFSPPNCFYLLPNVRAENIRKGKLHYDSRCEFCHVRQNFLITI